MYRKSYCIAVAIASLSLCGVASAHSSHHKRHRSPVVRYREADDQQTCILGGDALPFVRLHRANVMRLIIGPKRAGQGLVCVQRARAARVKVYLTLQFNNEWNIPQIKGWFRKWLAYYGRVWAVSVGCEQDLVQGTRKSTAKRYRQVWGAVAPLIHHAIRVYADASPWAGSWLRKSFGKHRPRGVGAVAYHCYDVLWGGLSQVPKVARWAARWRLPLWCSEMASVLYFGSVAVDQVHPPTLRAALRSPNLQMTSDYYWPPGTPGAPGTPDAGTQSVLR